MEEEECDYRTPIGKVIKHINTLCKKPKIDDELSKALDLFTEKLEEQEKYLANGIMKINFSEAALFLQSSTELYGKKIDALWDELLEFHTRLITYECQNQQKKGLSVDKTLIEKLEERRNRNKRRKKFKLILKQSQAEKLRCFLFDEEEKENRIGIKRGRDQEKLMKGIWSDYEYESREMRKIPCIVYKQMLQEYMLKNYHVLECQDFEIWDLEDEEFNTKYSRVPSWHHMYHLFDYNDKGLLPDNNNIIARLRLDLYGRIRYMASNGIPFSSPFENYKDAYMTYREEFFAEEGKKWQNMPLDNAEDLRKQLQFLAQKERREKGEPPTCGEIYQMGRYGVKVVQHPHEVDRIEITDTSDEDSLFELSVDCDKDFVKSDLFVRLEKLSSDIINTKLRQDSGFFEFNSDSDRDCDANLDSAETGNEGATTAIDEDGTVNSTAEVAIIADNGKDSTDVTNADLREIVCGDNIGGNCTNANGIIDGVVENQTDDQNNAEIPNADLNLDNLETRSFISDHDYCRASPPNLEICVEDNDGGSNTESIGISVDNNDNVTNIDANVEDIENGSIDDDLERNIPPSCDKSLNKTVEEIITKPFCGASRIVSNVIKITKKEKPTVIRETNNGESPPKRRKLSQKQIDKLLKGKIKPCKLKKFESFFSMNYLSQFGEGDVPIIEYESEYSDESDSENPDGEIPQDHANENHPDVDLPIIEEQSGIQLKQFDHDYCQPTTDNILNDSGFVEGSNVQPIAEGESTRNEPENSSCTENTSQCIAGESSVLSLEDEFQRQLAILNEAAGATQGDNTPIYPLNERDLQELEAEESRNRVEEWRRTITPILRGLKEQEFDIHEYGSKIMDGLEVNESKPFGDIVQGKSSAEVVRYFISSLQLANTNNIEICGVQQGQLSNDTYHVKLLTKDRYHEHLNEYLAPSEETLREKLDRVRAAMDAERDNSGSSPAKKIKLMIAPSKAKRNARTYTPRKRGQNENKKMPLSSSNHNIQFIQPPSPAVRRETTSVPKQSSYQLKSLKIVLNPVHQSRLNEYSNVVQSQEILNKSESERKERLLAKGKSIVKRQTVSRSQPYILNTDISMPSTSRQVDYTFSDTDPQMPSTSFQRFSPSPDVIETGFYFNNEAPSTSFSVNSSNQRRRESTEESFRERLATVQETNPDVQLQSTPNEPPSQSKQAKTSVSSSLKRSLLFE